MVWILGKETISFFHAGAETTITAGTTEVKGAMFIFLCHITMIFHVCVPSGNWSPPLRWYHPMPDKCTWDLTWVHLYLRMPMSSRGGLSLEQVSKARYPSCLRRFPARLKRMSVSISCLFFAFLSLSWLWLPSLRAHGNSCTETRTNSQAKHSQVVRADIPPSLHYISQKKKQIWHTSCFIGPCSVK